MLATALSVGKGSIRPLTACEIFGNRKEYLVVFAPEAHAVPSAVILIHPVLESGEASLDLFLVFLGKSVLVFKVESDKTASGKVSAILTNIYTFDGALEICGNKRYVFKICIVESLGLIQHFGKLTVAALCSLVCHGLNKEHVVGKLCHNAYQKCTDKAKGNQFHDSFHSTST